MEKTNCKRCGIEFSYSPSAKSKYCSKECYWGEKPVIPQLTCQCGCEEKFTPSEKSYRYLYLPYGKVPKYKRWHYSKTISEKQRLTSMAGNRKGKSNSLEHREKISKAIKGRKCPWVIERNVLIVHRGPEHWNWRGGITGWRKSITSTKEYREWRKSVFERDNYTCQECGKRNGNGKKVVLNAHHKKEVCNNKDLVFVLDNGITLCKQCHYKTYKFYGNQFNRII